MTGSTARQALVIEEWGLARWGVEFVLQRSGFTRVHTASTAMQARAALRDDAVRPVLAVVGSVSDRSVVAVTRTLTVDHRCAVIALLSPRDIRNAVAVLRAGARAVLEREARTVDLQEALRAVVDGRRHLSSGILAVPGHLADANAVRRDDGDSTAPPLRDLTPRERDVLSGIVAGQSNRAIARHLAISEETVKTHVTHLFQKLGVHGRSEAVGVAVRRHLV